MNFLQILLIMVLLSHACFVFGQRGLSKKEKKAVIDSTCALLDAYYIDDEKAGLMISLIKKKRRHGFYDTIQNYKSFAAIIQQDLIEIADDKHFHFMYNPPAIEESMESGEDATLTALLNDSRINHGFREVKIMEGNVGYLKLDRIPYPSDADKAMVGAMNMLSNVDALIIDLTDNRGGYGEMLQTFMSYFFPYPVHINTLNEVGEEAKQFWTYPYRNGPLLDSIQIYIVTSRRTFSAGEWLAYSMQEHNRAIIVGEVSKGGATPSEFYYINEHFMIMIPNSECVSPVSGTNFNNIGVQPDVKCSFFDAVDKSYLLAIEYLNYKSENEQHKLEYKWIMDGLQAKLTPYSTDSLQCVELCGSYGRSEITVLDNELFFKTAHGKKYRLVGIEKDFYCLEGLEHFRIKIRREGDKVIGFDGVYSTGFVQQINKDSEE